MGAFQCDNFQPVMAAGKSMKLMYDMKSLVLFRKIVDIQTKPGTCSIIKIAYFQPGCGAWYLNGVVNRKPEMEKSHESTAY